MNGKQKSPNAICRIRLDDYNSGFDRIEIVDEGILRFKTYGVESAGINDIP
jgi:hypothetical protein